MALNWSSPREESSATRVFARILRKSLGLGAEMFSRNIILLVTVVVCTSAYSAQAENHVLAELRFLAHIRAEKTAGGWVDVQYLGYVKELVGSKMIIVLCGK